MTYKYYQHTQTFCGAVEMPFVCKLLQQKALTSASFTALKMRAQHANIPAAICKLAMCILGWSVWRFGYLFAYWPWITIIQFLGK